MDEQVTTGELREKAEEKTGIRWLLDAVAVGFIAVSVDNAMKQEWARAALAFVFGIILGYSGLKWHKVRVVLNQRLVGSAERIGSDARTWLLLILVTFVWVAFPHLASPFLHQDGSKQRPSDQSAGTDIYHALRTPSDRLENSNKTVAYLLGLYRGKTMIQGQALLQPYIGTVVSSSGHVLAVGDDGPGYFAIIDGSDGFVDCRFNKLWGQRPWPSQQWRCNINHWRHHAESKWSAVIFGRMFR